MTDERPLHLLRPSTSLRDSVVQFQSCVSLGRPSLLLNAAVRQTLSSSEWAGLGMEAAVEVLEGRGVAAGPPQRAGGCWACGFAVRASSLPGPGTAAPPHQTQSWAISPGGALVMGDVTPSFCKVPMGPVRRRSCCKAGG